MSLALELVLPTLLGHLDSQGIVPFVQVEIMSGNRNSRQKIKKLINTLKNCHNQGGFGGFYSECRQRYLNHIINICIGLFEYQK